RRRHTEAARDWSSDVCSSDLDTSTEEHTRRVATLAVEIGEQLGLSPNRLRSLAIGGLLHDIGKLSVPESILQKPAALDDGEYARSEERRVGKGVRVATRPWTR